MKNFKDYLAESTIEHSYRIKFACPVTDAMLDRMETHLKKYEAIEVSKPKKLIAQSSPLDFKESRGAEITIVDITTQYPVPSNILSRELAKHLRIGEGDILIRSPEDEEKEQSKYTAKLTDAEYSDAEDVKSSDYYGDDHNSKFVKELLKVSKNRQKALESTNE